MDSIITDDGWCLIDTPSMKMKYTPAIPNKITLAKPPPSIPIRSTSKRKTGCREYVPKEVRIIPFVPVGMWGQQMTRYQLYSPM